MLAGLHSSILISLRISSTYFCWEIKIPFLKWASSIHKKYLNLFVSYLKFSNKLFNSVRKIRLIQLMVITLGRGGGGGGNRVMVSFCKFKLCECKRQLYASI